MRLLIILSAVVALAACKQNVQLPSVISPYRIDIQQGNVVTQDMVAKLKAGMTRSQVRFVLGSPLVTDMFHNDRWDYVYLMQRQGKADERRRLTVIFDGDKLLTLEGDIVLTDKALEPAPAVRSAPVIISSEPKPAPKAEAAKADAAKAEAAKADAAKAAAAKAKAEAEADAAKAAAAKAKADAAKAEAAKADAAKAAAAKAKAEADAAKAAAAKTKADAEAAKAEAAKAVAAKPEAAKTDAAKSDAAKTDESKADPAKSDAAVADDKKDTPKKGVFGRMLDKIGF